MRRKFLESRRNSFVSNLHFPKRRRKGVSAQDKNRMTSIPFSKNLVLGGYMSAME